MLWSMRAEQSHPPGTARVLILGYSALLSLGLALSSPWWLTRMATTRRYREGFAQRLGRVPRALRAAATGHRIVWVHAVSVGEVLAVSRLLGELESSLNQNASHSGHVPSLVVLSTTTRTGQALARKRFGADRVFYLPLDFAWAVRAFLRALQPAMLVLAESELWPRLLHECHRAGVPVAVVNARVSDRSFRRARRIRRLWRRVLRRVSLWLAQSDGDAQRLFALGVPTASVHVTGNLKYDVREPGENLMTRQIGSSLFTSGLIVAGSTLPGEEAALLRMWPEVLRARPETVLLLAPRHPERFDEVFALLQSSGFASFRCSERLQIADPSEAVQEGAVLLLDTIGDLASLYRLADVAFIGGSLVPKGGHNPLEPARFGVPVVMGPSFENFRDIVARLQAADGIRILRSAADLPGSLIDLLQHPEAARALGERGRAVFEREQGATARTVAALTELLAAAGPLQPVSKALPA